MEKSVAKGDLSEAKKQFGVQERRKRANSASVLWYVVLSRQNGTERPNETDLPTSCATRSEEVASQQEILGLPRSGMSPQMGNLTHDTHRSAQLS